MEKKLTQEDFLNRCKETHGDRYDYSRVIYVNKRTKVEIICPKHGSFFQNPNGHYSGNNCPKCRTMVGKIKPLELDEVIKKFRKVHGHRYDYSKVNYSGCRKKVEIICSKHGSFWINPHNHDNGQGCKKCGIEKRALSHNYNKDIFIKISATNHNGKYDYSKVIYTNQLQKVEIICPKHGSFFQTAKNHLGKRSHGCSRCQVGGKIELEFIQYFKSLGFTEEKDFLVNDRTVLNGKEIDFYFPSYNLAIEYNGGYWHRNDSPSRKLEKTKLCEAKGIKLIHIEELTYLNKKEVVLSRLEGFLGKSPQKLMARKCEITMISSAETMAFFQVNHLQDCRMYDKNYALQFGGETVAVMSFIHHKSKNYYELVRFANKLHHNIPGNASKLLSAFQKDFPGAKIISYADRAWSSSTSNIYLTLGFTETARSGANYYWCDKKELFNKFNFRKAKLIKRYPSMNFSMDMTEVEMCESLGFFKVYNCGTITYELKS